jgi:hydrogenase maturation protease
VNIAIIGVGTIIFQDEGVGVYAQKYMDSNFIYDKEITFVDGGVLGFKLMTYYQDYDKVLILDTITIDDEPGSIYNLPAEELLGLGSYKQTAHEVEVTEMLEICSLLEKMAEVHIIGIVPQDIQSVNVGLSDKIKDNFEIFIKTALDALEGFGVQYQKLKNIDTLDKIIQSYANPQSEYKNGLETDYQIQ